MKQRQQVLEYPKLKYFTTGLDYGQAVKAYQEKKNDLKLTSQTQRAQGPIADPYTLSPKTYRNQQNLLDFNHQLELIRQKKEQVKRRYQDHQHLLSKRAQQLKKSHKQYQKIFIKRIYQEQCFQKQKKSVTNDRINIDDIRDKQKSYLEQIKHNQNEFQKERKRIQQDNANRCRIQLRNRQQNNHENKMEIQNNKFSLQSVNNGQNNQQSNPQEKPFLMHGPEAKQNQISAEQNSSSLFKINKNLLNANNFQGSRPNQPTKIQTPSIFHMKKQPTKIQTPSIFQMKKQQPKMVGLPLSTNFFGQQIMPPIFSGNIFGNNITVQKPIQKPEIQNKPLFVNNSNGLIQPAGYKTQPDSPNINVMQQPNQARTQKKTAKDFIKSIKIQTPYVWNQTLPQQKSAVENYKRVDAQLADSGLKSILFSENKILSAQAKEPKHESKLFQQKTIAVNSNQVSKPSQPVQKIQIESIEPPKNLSNPIAANIFNQKVYEPSKIIKKQQVPQNMVNKSNQVAQSIFNKVETPQNMFNSGASTIFTKPPQNFFNKPTQTTNNVFNKPTQTAQNLFNKPKQAATNFFSKPAQKAQNIESKISQPQQNMFNESKDCNILNTSNNNTIKKPSNVNLFNQPTNSSLFIQPNTNIFNKPPNSNVLNDLSKPNLLMQASNPSVSTNMFTNKASSSNLFSSNSAQTNLFSKQPSSLFTSTLNTQNNMFNNKPNNVNVNNAFNNNNNQNQDDQEAADDQLLQKEQEIGGDPKLSNANFQYQQANVLFKDDATKFKIVNPNVLIQNVRVSYEKYPNSNNTLLIVRLANKVVSFTGVIIPGKTEIYPISASSQSAAVKNILKIDGSVKSPQSLRILFKTSEAVNKFLQVSKQVLAIK